MARPFLTHFKLTNFSFTLLYLGAVGAGCRPALVTQYTSKVILKSAQNLFVRGNWNKFKVSLRGGNSSFTSGELGWTIHQTGGLESVISQSSRWTQTRTRGPEEPTVAEQNPAAEDRLCLPGAGGSTKARLWAGAAVLSSHPAIDLSTFRPKRPLPPTWTHQG